MSWFKRMFGSSRRNPQAGKETASKPEQEQSGPPDQEVIAMVVRASAPDNMNPFKADKIMEMGPEVVPALIHVFQNAKQSGNVSGAACDQGMLGALLLSHARNGDKKAAAFLRKVANGEVQIYDHGGQRAHGLAQDFVKENG